MGFRRGPVLIGEVINPMLDAAKVFDAVLAVEDARDNIMLAIGPLDELGEPVPKLRLIVSRKIDDELEELQ